MTTKHTPLKHTHDCGNHSSCQKSHSHAKFTDQQKHTCERSVLEKTKAELSEHALSAEKKMLKENGLKTAENSSQDTEENAFAAEKVSRDFSQLTTFMVTAQPNVRMESVVGGFINGLLKTASLEQIINCFVTTAIALEDSSENAPTKNSSRLIAAAPELLDALEYAHSEISAIYELAKLGGPYTVSIGQFRRLETLAKAIAKAKGGAA